MTLDVIENFFDAAVGENDWALAVESMSQAFGGATLVLADGNPADHRSFSFANAAFDNSVFSKTGIEPTEQFDPRSNWGLRANLGIPLNRSINRRAVISDSTMNDCRLLREVMQTNRMREFRTMTLIREHDTLAGGVISPPAGLDDFDPETVRKLDRLLPFVSRAFRLKRQLGARREDGAALQTFLDHVPLATMLVASDLRVAFANAEADQLIEKQDGVLITRGRLRCADHQLQRALRDTVAAIALTTVAPPATLRVPRPSGLPAYEISAFPAVGMVNAPGCHRAVATLTISDPAAAHAPAEAGALADRFGLTVAEARVARLVPFGLSKRQVAERLGLSENTVRTHLASIRAKLGARSVTELAALLARSRRPPASK